jgi:hypothetical protein
MAYEVIWRDGDGGQRCETFSTRRQADARDREIRDLRSRGKDGAIDAGGEPLRKAAERWWTDHVEPSIAISTSKVYATVVDRHLLPRLGDRPIRDILPGDVIALQRDLRGDGIGEHMTQKTLMVLSGIMRHSQLLGTDPTEPCLAGADQAAAAQACDQTVDARGRGADAGVRAVAWPTARGDDPVRARVCGAPAGGGICAELGLRRRADPDRGAWTGRRLVEGDEDRSDQDRVALGAARVGSCFVAVGHAALMFARTNGGVFRDTDYRNWRTRHFDSAAAAAGADGATPYTLRHSFASLLVQAGWNALKISSEMGNSPEVVQRDYSHLFREFARGQRIDPEETIEVARRALASGRLGEVSADGRSA